MYNVGGKNRHESRSLKVWGNCNTNCNWDRYHSVICHSNDRALPALHWIAVKIEVKIEKCDRKALEWEMVEDERDKLIEIKVKKIGFAITGIGFIVDLVSPVLFFPEVMIHIIYFIPY